jgi:hypothetical protein
MKSIEPSIDGTKWFHDICIVLRVFKKDARDMAPYRERSLTFWTMVIEMAVYQLHLAKESGEISEEQRRKVVRP